MYVDLYIKLIEQNSIKKIGTDIYLRVLRHNILNNSWEKISTVTPFGYHLMKKQWWYWIKVQK